MNVALAPTRAGAPEGSWCFALGDHLNETEVAVVVSTLNTGGPYRHHYLLESAQWVAGAPACTRGARNQIEIQATGIITEGGKLVAVPDHEAAFSFTVNAK
jgi:hypothetical protein